MKSVDIKIDDPSLRAAAEKATRELDKVIGKYGEFAKSIDATWTQSVDFEHRPMLEIRVSDMPGAATTRLTPGDVNVPDRLYEKMLVLFGDLLRSQSKATLKRLTEELAAQG